VGCRDIETKSGLENCFLAINKAVETLPQQTEWSPFPFPAERDQIDFTDGLLTLAGSDDPNLEEGRVARGYITEILGLDMGNT
jgi:homogentisate 1,2-dioxygenase